MPSTDYRSTGPWGSTRFDVEGSATSATTDLLNGTTLHLEHGCTSGTSVLVTDNFHGTTDSSLYSFDIVIFLSVVVSFIILVTVTGNLLVIVSFLTTPKLHTYNNYFILGLAMADLLVGAVDMPLFAIVVITGKWPFGAMFCDIFTFLDHAFSHISILLVTLISFDRCIALTYPLRHRKSWRRRSRALIIITISYVIPIIIWLPMTTLWQVIHGVDQRSIPDNICHPLYIDSVLASVTAPVLFLFIPFTITSIFCARIYVVIKRFYKNRRKSTLTFHNIQSTRTSNDITSRDISYGRSISASESKRSDISVAVDHGKETGIVNSSDAGSVQCGRRMKARHVTIKKERIGSESMKGVRILVFIVTAMWIAWFPSVIVVITSSICSACLPDAVYSMVIFWGYTNSLMNPICYALADVAFKDAFKRILSCRCIATKKRNVPHALPNV